MGLLTPCSVPRGGFLYTMIVPGGGFLLPSSRVLGICPGGMVMDEIDTCINNVYNIKLALQRHDHFLSAYVYLV